MTVYHLLKANRYVRMNAACSVAQFTEQFEEVAGKEAHLTERLKDFSMQQALAGPAHALVPSFVRIGIRLSRETILRLVETRGAMVVAQNLAGTDVRVLALDGLFRI